MDSIKYVDNENFNSLINLVADCVREGIRQEDVNSKVAELINSKFTDDEKNILKGQFKDYLKRLANQ